MTVSQRPRLPLLAFTAVLTAGLVTVGCSRSSSTAQGSTSGSPTPAASSAAASAVGDFGSLKKVCGPGTPKGPTARGLTDSTIRIGVNSDAGAAAAPGIEQEFFDASEAFTKWCNAAGGINGRKIVIDKWDAKLFNVAQTTLNACQKDFMLVGGGNALDNAGVKPRLACKLGTIPAYTVTTECGRQCRASGQDPARYRHAGAVRPDTGCSSRPTPISRPRASPYRERNAGVTDARVGLKQQYALEHNGFKVTAVQVQAGAGGQLPALYGGQLKGAMARPGSIETSGQDITPEIQAMKNVGWTPQEVSYSYQFYTAQAVEAAKSLKTFPPIYIALDYLPFATGVDTPAIREIRSQLSSTVSTPKYTQFTLESYDSWLLFATSAAACGDNLTQDCVLQKAGSYTDWTAAGLSPPVSTSPAATTINDCTAVVRLTVDGWVYDKGVTRPNNGYFNCDPKNIATVPANP